MKQLLLLMLIVLPGLNQAQVKLSKLRLQAAHTNYPYRLLDAPRETLTESESTYKITKNKVAGWSMILLSGMIDGARDVYSIDRTVFEQLWGVPPKSYFGSLSWTKYHDNEVSFYERTTNSANDFWHHSHDLSVVLKISGGVMIALNGKPKWLHVLIDLGVSFVSQSLGYNITYNWLKT